MSAHTPGPWSATAIFWGQSRIETQNGTTIAGVSAPDGPNAEATINANARLIAAAPELLQACELILAIHDHPEQQSHPIQLDPQALAQLRRAIAKATGANE